jgi:hypothetical protein
MEYTSLPVDASSNPALSMSELENLYSIFTDARLRRGDEAGEEVDHIGRLFICFHVGE